MSEKELISRDLSPEDCARLPSLMKKVWKTRTTRDYWQWKFFESPSKTMGLVIENRNGDIVGFSSFWLRPARFGKKDILSGTLVDVMVDPEYRGGLALRAILKRIQSEIVPKLVLFGFTNPISHKIFARYFKEFNPVQGNIPVFLSLVNAGSCLSTNRLIRSVANSVSRSIHKLRLTLHCNRNILVQQTQNVGDEFDRLWEDVSREYFWIQHRGKDFIKWRYTLDPTRKYQIWKATEGNRVVGYLVTTINQEPDKTRGLFMDWLVSRKRDDVFREMVKTAFSWLVDQKVDLVEAWLMDHEKQWAKILKSYLFVKSKRTRSFLVGGGPEWNDPDLRKTENFFFAIGDSDYLGTPSA